MNSISPQMLGLTGNVTLLKGPSDGDGPAVRGAALKSLLRAVVRWRWVLIGGIAAGAMVGVIVTLLTPRQYASTARLQIARETAQVVSLGAVQRDVSIGDQEFYQTQYGLMRAQDLAERVARDLGAVDDAAFFTAFAKGDKFAANPGAAGRDKRNEIAGRILLDHVEVAPIHGSSLVDIQARAPSPALAQKIARTWSQDFIASNLERRFDASSYARQFLETRLDQLRGRLEASERQAAYYASTHGIIDLPSTAYIPKSSMTDSGPTRSLITDDLIAFNGAREGATAESIAAQARLAAVGAQPDASADALANRAIGVMRDRRADAAAEYAKLMVQSAPDEAATKAARARLDALDAAIKIEENRIHTSLQQAYQAASARPEGPEPEGGRPQELAGRAAPAFDPVQHLPARRGHQPRAL